MNQRLLKKLLVTSAVGASTLFANFSVHAKEYLFNTDHNTSTELPKLLLFETSDYKPTKDNLKLNIDHFGIGLVTSPIDSLDINGHNLTINVGSDGLFHHVLSQNYKITNLTNSWAKKKVNIGFAGTGDPDNFTLYEVHENVQLGDIDFNKIASDMTFKGKAEIGSVKSTGGVNGRVLVGHSNTQGTDGDLTILNDSVANHINIFETNDDKTKLTLKGKSKANTYQATKGEIHIKNDSDGEYIMDKGKIIFDSSESSISAKGDLTFQQETNSTIFFKGKSDHKIDFAGNINARCLEENENIIISVEGANVDLKKEVKGINKIEVKGNNAILSISGKSNAKNYELISGANNTLVIKNDSMGAYGVKGNNILEFDSRANVITANGNVDLSDGATLRFRGDNQIELKNDVVAKSGKVKIITNNANIKDSIKLTANANTTLSISGNIKGSYELLENTTLNLDSSNGDMSVDGIFVIKPTSKLEASGGHDVTIKSATYFQKILISGTGQTIFKEQVGVDKKMDLSYTSTGTLKAEKNFKAENVDFAGKEGTLKLNAEAEIKSTKGAAGSIISSGERAKVVIKNLDINGISTFEVGDHKDATLTIEAKSKAKDYRVNLGKLIIKNSAEGNFKVGDSTDARLVFDSTANPITATGSVDLTGANGTLETKGGNQITITKKVNNGKILISGAGTTIITKTVGAVDATAIEFNEAGTLQLNADSTISGITGDRGGNIDVNGGVTTIKGDVANGSTNFNVANNAGASLVFDSSMNAITANGNTTLAGANSQITFDANGHDITYNNNIIANTDKKGNVNVSGNRKTRITGLVGAAGSAVNNIEVNGVDANLVLEGVSHALAYSVTRGTLSIKKNANGSFAVADTARLVFDSNGGAVEATGNVNLNAAGTLETTAAAGNNITITGAVENGKILISGAGKTIINGTVGANNATAIEFAEAGTLQLNHNSTISVIIGDRNGTIAVNENTTTIQGNVDKGATSFNVADTAKLVFDSTGGAIEANGNTTLAGANSTITFNAAGNNIIYTGDITGTGKVIASGNKWIEIFGKVGNNGASVNLIQYNGNAKDSVLVLQGKSYATEYNVVNGEMVILSDATAGVGGFVVANNANAKLIFDSNGGAVEATGNVNLSGVDGQLVTIAAEGGDITIDGTVAHGRLLISGLGTTIINGTVGAVNTTAIEFGGAGTLQLNANSTISNITGAGNGTIAVNANTTTIQGNVDNGATSFNVADNAGATLAFDSTGGAIEANGNTTLAGVNSQITFNANVHDITYNGNINGAGQVIASGANKTTIGGTVGNSGKALALIQVDGVGANLVLKGESHALAYTVTRGKMTIKADANGAFNVENNSRLVFDARMNAIIANGNVDLGGVNETLQTIAIPNNQITIDGKVNNGKILISGPGTTSIRGTVGVANATAIHFWVGGTLELNADSNISGITGEQQGGKININGGITKINGEIENGSVSNFTVENGAELVYAAHLVAGDHEIPDSGNIKLVGANSKITFNAVNGNDIRYTGDINADVNGNGIVNASGKTTIYGTVGTEDNAVNMIQVNGAGANLVLEGESYAQSYNATQGTMTIKANAYAGNKGFSVADTARLVFDSNGGAVEATGNVNLTGANGTLETIAAGGNNITITGAVNNGKIVISGAGTTSITGTVGANNATGIQFDEAGKLELNADSTISGIIGNRGGIIAVNARTKIKGDVEDGAVSFTVADNARLVFETDGTDILANGNVDLGEANSTLQTIAAAGNNIIIDGIIDNGKILISGAGTTIIKGGVISTKKIEFDGAGTLNVSASGVRNGIDVDFHDNAGKIIVGGKDTVLGSVANPNGSTIIMIGETQGNQFNFTLGKVGSVNHLLNIDGRDIKPGKSITVSNESFFEIVDTGGGSLTYNGDTKISAKKIKGENIIIDNGNLTIHSSYDNVIESRRISFQSNHSFTIENNFSNFNVNVQSNNNNQGILNFNGSGMITSQVLGDKNHALAQVNIQGPNNIVTIDMQNNATHYVQNFGVASNSTLKINKNYHFVGNLNFPQNATLMLNNSTLTLDAAPLNLTDGANLEIIQAGKIVGDLQNNKFNLSVDTTAPMDKDGKILIIDNKFGHVITLKNSSVVLKNKSTTIEEKFIIEGSKGYLQRKVSKAKIHDQFLPNILPEYTSDDLNIFLIAFKNKVKAIDDYNQIKGEMLDFLTKAGSLSKEKCYGYIASLLPKDHKEINRHLIRVHSNFVNDINSRMIASASSDDLRKSFALWGKVTYGKANQEAGDIYSPSYEASSLGGTVGLELKLNDLMTVALASSYINTDLKYKGLLRRNKDEFKSIFTSIYGFAELKNNMVLNGSLVFGNSDIECEALDFPTNIIKKDNKISVSSFGGSLLAGYKIQNQNISFTPFLGFEFGNYFNPEQKTAGGLASIKEWETKHFDLVGGFSVGLETKLNNTTILPEIHGFYHHNIKNKKSPRVIQINGLPKDPTITFESVDLNKSNFSIGGSLTIKSSRFDCGVSLDGQFAERYYGVLGSIKLKLNL
jgi:hypothetical protein